MLNNSYGDETLEELTVAVIMMAQIQPADDSAVIEPNYDAKAVSEVNASHKMIPKGVHEHKNHRKRKTVVNTSDDDQIDSNIIFDNPYVENNGGSDEHDSNAHDEYHDIQILAYNVQREDENKNRLNNELKKQKELLQKELETCQERVKTFESKMVQCSKYKETREELKLEIRADKDTIKLSKNEKINLKDIVDLEEKLSSHDQIVYKIGQSVQTIHMLGKTPNKVYDPFIKAGLGYQNLERLKKAIAAQQKMYHGEMLYNTKLNIDSPDSEETLEDTKESRLKMRNKMVQLDYGKLNALYETCVPKKEPFVEQTYFSFLSTSNECSELK
ncbi:hypothetical protein Tco_0278173 [Tanacetum coccineum]